MRIAGVILAAGASRRLGQPKQLVRVQEERLLERTLRVVREAELHSVFVVLGAHAERIQMEVDLSEAVIVNNPEWETGMASSIRAGIAAVRAETPDVDAVMLLVCDQPLLRAEHLRRLMDAAKADAIVASMYSGVPGVPAVFPASAWGQLMELRGDAGARSLLNDASVITIAFEEGAMDVDTEEDLRRAAERGPVA
jgi:molybdenum cofactor cytidylyltransferase